MYKILFIAAILTRGDAPPPTDHNPPKLRASDGTEWQESPPSVISKQFYSVGPPQVSPPTVTYSTPVYAAPMYAAPMVTGSYMATRKSGRIQRHIDRLTAKLSRHQAPVTYSSPSFMYYNTAPTVYYP